MEKKKAVKIGVVLVIGSVVILAVVAIVSGLWSEFMAVGGIGTALGLGFLAKSRDNGSERQRDEQYAELARDGEKLENDIDRGMARAQDRSDRIETELRDATDESNRVNNTLRAAITRAKDRENT